MNQKQREAAKSNTLSAGDLVEIARRFFINHALPHRSIIGRVKELDGVYVWVVFAKNSVFQRCVEMGYIGEIDEQKDALTVLVKIHPVYLDRVKEKKRAKKK